MRQSGGRRVGLLAWAVSVSVALLAGGAFAVTAAVGSDDPVVPDRVTVPQVSRSTDSSSPRPGARQSPSPSPGEVTPSREIEREDGDDHGGDRHGGSGSGGSDDRSG